MQSSKESSLYSKFEQSKKHCFHSNINHPSVILFYKESIQFALLLQESLKRTCVGIWHCKGCGKTVAGGAWVVRYKHFLLCYVACSLCSLLFRWRGQTPCFANLLRATFCIGVLKKFFHCFFFLLCVWLIQTFWCFILGNHFGGICMYRSQVFVKSPKIWKHDSAECYKIYSAQFFFLFCLV